MAQEKLLANGTDLSTLVRGVESLAGLLTTPPRRGENVAVPGRNGQLYRPHKLYDSREFAIPLWVVGADPQTGVTPIDTGIGATEFLARIDELVRLFLTPQVTFEYTRPDGSVRVATAEVLDIFEPSRILGGPITGKVTVPLVMADPFWSDQAPISQSFTLATGAEAELTAFADATAPMDDLVITIGPCSNPEISQPAVGGYVAYDGIIATGHKLVIDTDQWKLLPGDGTAWTPDYAAFRHGGVRGPWFQLVPEPTRPPTIMVSHTAGGTAQFTVTGRRRYLTG